MLPGYKLMQASGPGAPRAFGAHGIYRLRDGFGRRQQRVNELGFRLDAAWRAELREQG